MRETRAGSLRSGRDRSRSCSPAGCAKRARASRPSGLCLRGAEQPRAAAPAHGAGYAPPAARSAVLRSPAAPNGGAQGGCAGGESACHIGERTRRPPPLVVPPSTAFCAAEAPAEGEGAESAEGWFEKVRAAARPGAARSYAAMPEAQPDASPPAVLFLRRAHGRDGGGGGLPHLSLSQARRASAALCRTQLPAGLPAPGVQPRAYQRARAAPPPPNRRAQRRVRPTRRLGCAMRAPWLGIEQGRRLAEQQ